MLSPPSKEQFNSRPEDSWPLFSLEFFWHGTLTEMRVSDFSPETHRFIQLSAVEVTISPLILFSTGLRNFPLLILIRGKEICALLKILFFLLFLKRTFEGLPVTQKPVWFYQHAIMPPHCFTLTPV